MTNHHGIVIKCKDWGIRRELSRRTCPQRLSLGRALIDNRSTALVLEVGENPLNGSALTLQNAMKI